jgi:thioredoxin-related protein
MHQRPNPAFFLLALSLFWGAPQAEEAPLAASLAYPEQPAWFKTSFLDLPEDIAEAAAQGRRVMLYFYQEGCPYCARLVAENLGDPVIAARTQELYDLIALNLWGDRELTDPQGNGSTEKRYGEALRVQYTPTLVILDESGQPALRINGYYPKERFALALEYGAGKGEAGQGFGRFADQRAPAVESAPLRSEPYFRGPPFDLRQRRDGKPLLVLFEQPDCADCATFHDQSLQHPANVELIQGFDVVQLNRRADTPVTTPKGEATTAAAWAEVLGISYTPSLVFFDEAGAEVFRVEAFVWSFHLQSALDYVASGAYREQPNFQRYLRDRREHMRERGLDVGLVD